MKNAKHTQVNSGPVLFRKVEITIRLKQILGLFGLSLCLVLGFHALARYSVPGLDSSAVMGATEDSSSYAHVAPETGHHADKKLIPLDAPAPTMIQRAAPEAEESTAAQSMIVFPISTHTELETFYSTSHLLETTTVTSTFTEHVVATPSTAATEVECAVDIVTQTEITIVTVTVSPTTTPTSTDGFVTVTGAPSTLSDTDEDMSFFPVITVSGTPLTLTEFQTQYSYTDLPDVTVSGRPSTVTNMHTDVSVTEGLPDATVSEDPSTVTEVGTGLSLTTSPSLSSPSSRVTVVISDLWDPQTLVTVTTVVTTTVTSTPTVVTITELFPVADSSSISDISHTSLSKGQGVTRSLTQAPLNTNGTAVFPTGSAATAPVPTTPVIVAGSSEKPDPRGSSYLSCIVMIVAMAAVLL